MSVAWYVLRSKPNKEDFLWGQVQAHQLEVYFPSIKSNAVNPRARRMKPYFPGYLFVRLDMSRVAKSFWMWLPGSRGLVCFDEVPAHVPDAMITAIMRKVDEINAAGGEQLAGLHRGDKVIIHSGAFADYEGVFDACVSGNERVRVLLKLLRNRMVPVELPSAQITRKKQSS